MSDPSKPETEPQWARPLHERQVAMLGELAEAGLVLAVAAKDLATAPEGGVEPGVLEGLTRTYARAARAVRLSLMLQDRLIKDLTAFDKRMGQEAVWDQGQRLRERKGQVARIMGRVIARTHDDDDEIDRLAAETAERLDHEDFYGPILDRPVGELVAMICRDLGLAPDWAGLSQEAWAQEDGIGEGAGWSGVPPNSSPVGGGGPAVALAKAGGGGTAADGSFPFRHGAYPRRATSPDGGGIETCTAFVPPS
jgi:hypothetical protein